jgi:lipoprotein-anchoring transpeptidase ErfK/SrfK
MSSGLPRYPTVEGTYRVYARYVQTRMQGGEGADYYNIPDVPYTLYFYSGYALHGAYWHNSFGTPQSHGCVNLPVDAAKWVFEWAPIGTMVVSHK